MSPEQRVRLTVEDGLAQLSFSAPERHNAIDPAWVAALGDAVDAIAADGTVRAVLVTADGASFSVGGDLAHFAREADRMPDELDAMVRPFHRTLATLGDLPVPIVCAAQGPVAGGGLGLLWCADIVLVADTAKLAAGFPLLGLSGDGGSAWALPRLVGLRRAQQFILGGKVLNADEAVEWGIASEVVPAADLADRALAEGRRFAAGPTVAYGHARRLLRGASTVSWAEHLTLELDAQVACGATDDAREGVAAFAARRPAAFTGR
ncbi:1,2-epoxyphenylacetyl-CoA isomerase [Paraconexibacter sp. AEG42_29]|uniref:1,2-epoxyphenylacetyl-CoA isomerase n=1 Tax=Paraconexibacter sp. AEG42_29 TaxID=2997339 RepID=A0AAU7B1B4_9ACTN